MEIQEEKQKVEPRGIPHRCWWLEGLKYIGEKKNMWRHGGLCLTLPETNIAPKNRPPQQESHIPTVHF